MSPRPEQQEEKVGTKYGRYEDTEDDGRACSRDETIVVDRGRIVRELFDTGLMKFVF